MTPTDAEMEIPDFLDRTRGADAKAATDTPLPPHLAALTARRKRLLATGYAPIPANGKAVRLAGWSSLRPTEADIEMWARERPADTNTGLLTRDTPAVDIDVYDVDMANDLQHILVSMIGDNGRVIVRVGRAPKRAILFRTDAPFSKVATPTFTSPDGGKHRVEVLCSGQQVIVFGRHPDTGQNYTWSNGEPGEVVRDELPYMDEAMAAKFIAKATEVMKARGWTADNEKKPQAEAPRPAAAAAAPSSPGGGREQGQGAGGGRTYLGPNQRPALREQKYAAAALEGCAEELAATTEGERNNKLNKVAFRMGRMVARGWIERDAVRDALLAAAQACGLGEAEAGATLASGLEDGMANPQPDLAERASDEPDVPPGYSEDALALHFTERHGEDLRYVAAWGKWFRYDGQRWRADDTLRVFDLARQLCRETAQRARDIDKAPKCTVSKIASAKTVAAIEHLARFDRVHAATIAQWDPDHLLLNTPAGTVDLRTGEMRAAARADYITKITAVAPGGDCPKWRAFLERITDGDRNLEAYLQRIAGYALTGSTREHALFFFYGLGANGKSTMVNILENIFADYARTAPIETFTEASSDRHPTELAMLRGARLVIATEIEEGRRWAESRIKLLTGGDPIAARFMRQDFFEYIPQFKLLVVGNHKPQLRCVDEAMRRRLHLIPFRVIIPPRERDPTLPQKLALERGGILAWAIEGCLEWQRIGLAPPASVVSATEAYLADEDAFGIWLADRCELGAGYETATSVLFASWVDWCVRTGEQPGKQKAFVQALEARGFTRARDAGGRGLRGFRGLRVHDGFCRTKGAGVAGAGVV
jgi:P4 family phage/plasmid primase-like protien